MGAIHQPQVRPDGKRHALIDWYDQQACHDRTPGKWDRTNGRVYKISYRGTKPVTALDLAKCSDDELVQYQTHANEWYARHARRILQERAASISERTKGALAKLVTDHADTGVRQRALWTLAAVGGLTGERLDQALANDRGHVRSWAVRLAADAGGPATQALAVQLPKLAADTAPAVRLAVAGVLQRPALRSQSTAWEAAIVLLKSAQDGDDPNLPYLVWYAAEPFAAQDADRALHMASHAKGQLLEHMVRRIGSVGTPEAFATVVERLGRTDDVTAQATILDGLRQSLKGRRNVAMPAEWPAAYRRLASSVRGDVRESAMAVAVTFGDPQALSELREIVVSTAAAAKRQAAVASLIEANDAKLPEILRSLLGDPVLRAAAIRGLAVRPDAKTPAAILAVYAKLPATEKRDAVATLSSDREFANELLAAVERGAVPSTDVPADLVRQLRAFKDAALDARLAKVWGVVRETQADRKRQIETYRRMLTAKNAPKADVALGRAVYAKTCQQCHVLFGVGGKVGPEITGANRGDLGYLLENVLDPSAVIPKEYAVTSLLLKSGRLVLGIVREETPAALTVVTATETLTVPKADISTREPSDQSMMPDDQLKPMTEAEVRGLFAYLQSPVQTPQLATPETAATFFDGKDLAGWDGDPKLWSVENGEIVGRSPGIKKNEFLKSHLMAGDFKLTLKVKLTPNKENSGIQFRSEVLSSGDVKGLQADVGAGWWGKLYEEHGREILWNKSGEQHVKADDWNEYVVEAVGDSVKTWINGQLCVDRADRDYARRGIFAFQIHSGGPMEVRFKDIRLELR
ncbi:MAG: family 16 glycoside hydrolase [Gemmataceae bacterium]